MGPDRGIAWGRGLFRRRRAACRALQDLRPVRTRAAASGLPATRSSATGDDEMTATDQDKGAVIVTGASRGIGAAIAEKLADDGYGVIVNYAADAEGAESVVSAIRAKGGRAEAVRADVASEDDITAMFDQAQEQMGPLTALVNNAGS